MAAKYPRSSCLVQTLLGQLVEPGSAQWGWGLEKKKNDRLKLMRMDLERIRNLMSEVISCVPGWNSSEAVKLGTSLFRAKKIRVASVRTGMLAVAESGLTRNNTALTEWHQVTT